MRISITTILMMVVVLFISVGCKSEKKEYIAAITDRAKTPRLHATDISTVISDSGITRYRIYTPQWDVYDKAAKPYWEFPKGIHFERFDLNLKVDANIHSSYARYFEVEQIWELRGKVRATNIKGDLLETEQLFWNQQQEKFYTDSTFKLTQSDKIVKGKGFTCNQTMTSYEVKKPIGTFAVNENETKVAQPSPATSQQQNNGIPAQQIKAPVRPFMPPAGKGQIPIQQRVPINPRQQPQVKATGNIIKKMR